MTSVWSGGTVEAVYPGFWGGSSLRIPPWYWIVDLEALSVEVLRNDDGTLAEVQTIRSGEPAETVGPFPVPIDPADLVA
jgi:hypothetical protein